MSAVALIAGSNGNTGNLEVLEVACVFIRIEAIIFPHFNIGLCFAVQNIHVTLTVTANFN